MTRVQVLGAGGMLGGMLAGVLGADPHFELAPASGVADGFDARRDDPSALLAAADAEWVLNAIGVLRARIDDSDPARVADAFAVNAEFPARLAAAAGAQGRRVVHFSTDAVFAGTAAPYDEHRRPDATDLYGRSKSAGEVEAPQVVNLRCSIVGPEAREPRSLLGWALAQPPGARITGYEDQLFNGLTTLHVARICGALIDSGTELPPTLHLVPADAVTKAELLEIALAANGRDDVVVEHGPGPAPRDLRLATVHPQLNSMLWELAGYARAPTIAAMLGELGAFGGARSD